MKRLLTTAILLAIQTDVFADKLSAPLQMYPIDESTDIQNSSVAFKWQKVTGAGINGYRVVISENKRFTGYSNTRLNCIDKTCILGNIDSPSTTTFTTPLRFSGKTYYWKVQAISGSNGKWSKINTFKTAGGTTSQPQVLPTTINTVTTDKNSVAQGSNITFSALLSNNLPLGYSLKIDFGNGLYTMNGTGTNYSLTQTPTTLGVQLYKIGIYDSSGLLQKDSIKQGTFEITKLNTAPTLSIVSAADTATVGSAYFLQLQANDVDGNLSYVQISNWGDGASDSQVASNGTNLSFQHTFNSAGTYIINTTAYDSANATSSAISKNITVSTKAVVTNPTPTTSTTGYTKIANNGSVLSDSAKLGANPTDWACTKDNKTGLIWEVKTTDGGLRDSANSYSNYTPDYPKCDWSGCETDFKGKYGDSTNTDGFVSAVNNQSLCGADDWRLPTRDELQGLVYCSDGKYNKLTEESLNSNGYDFICKSNENALTTTSPTINATYFSDIKDNYWFWSSSPYASSSYDAWSVNFSSGLSDNYVKDSGVFVRLVR